MGPGDLFYPGNRGLCHIVLIVKSEEGRDLSSSDGCSSTVTCLSHGCSLT